jgi:WD40 repeat protein
MACVPPAFVSASDLFTEKHRIVLKDPTDRVIRSIWDPGGSKLLLVTQRSTQIWSSETGRLLVDFEEPFSNRPGMTVSWQPNGSRILLFYASPSGEDPATLWDSETGKRIAIMEEKEGVIRAEWNRSGNRILTVGDWTSGSPTKRFSFSLRDGNGKAIRSEEHTAYAVHNVTLSNSGTDIIVSFRPRRNQKPIRLFDADTGQLRRGFDHNLESVNPLTYVIFVGESPDAKYLCGRIDTSKGLTCWRSDDDTEPIYSFLDTKETGDNVFLGFSPGSDRIAVLRSRQRAIVIANAATGETELVIDLPENVKRVTGTREIPFRMHDYGNAWSHNGKYYVVSDVENEVSIWDVAGKRLVAKRRSIWASNYDWFVGTLPSDYEVFSFNRKNHLLLSVSNQLARVWDPSNGELLREFGSPTRELTKATFQRSTAAWDPKGDRLTTAEDQNRAIIVWSVNR